MTDTNSTSGRPKAALKVVGVLFFLYLFFISIQLMGDSFKTWKGFSETLIEQAANPFVGLFIGILATSVIQSSSTTTCMIVGFVASGVLPIEVAVPMVMGANIGTSVTNTLVSLGHVHRRDEFNRAMACATVHDIFNVLSVAVLMPLELATGWLQFLATRTAVFIQGMGGLKFTSPLKAITKPVSSTLQKGIEGVFSDPTVIAVVGLIVSAVLLFSALYAIVKLMRSMVLTRLEVFFHKYVGGNAFVGIGLGMVITVMVQSSSITTSILVPLAGAGVITLAHAFPITLGANVGTTITALLACLAAGEGAGQTAALAIALVHLFFNIHGILVWYPLPFMRRLPLWIAEKIAAICRKRRWMALVYVGGVFFVVPGILILLYKMFS